MPNIFPFRSRYPAAQKSEAVSGPPASAPAPQSADVPATEAHPETHEAKGAATDASADAPEPTDSSAPAASPADEHPPETKPAENAPRRFSWMPFSRTNSGDAKHVLHEQEKKPAAEQAASRPLLVRTRSEKQAQQCALFLRELIVGPSSNNISKAKPKTKSHAELEKAKAQLANQKTANKVIAQLRQLSSSDEPVVVGMGPNGEMLTALPKGPIHAVCLPYTDAEAHERHFRRLEKDNATATGAVNHTQGATTATTTTVHFESTTTEIVSVANASITTLKMVFSEMNLVSLITTPDLGLGGPPDGPGILSGALPTPQAILDGVEKVTPQLLALGYATGKAVLPDHAGIYPPKDRMSAITYWWGFEIVLPQPSLRYLENVPSITHSVINFLTALSVVDGGVREIIPFVRYISSFIDTEFNMIKSEDKGDGVVCAATWIMPAALVPRPWDFPQPPPRTPSAPTAATSAEGEKGTTEQKSAAPSDAASAAPATAPNAAPVSVTPGDAPAASNPAPTETAPKVEVTPPTPAIAEADISAPVTITAA
ncbi:uncharacterized protein LAESUDRAFT_720993 [Laetiporus sulphureus 93-53]|uniref:Uncharacterized protein n=1 Tax=Laetiporus sulphureus 93-53 TaxID=1314785 RepID=A0A165GPR9_9APHY|nr:uncharacterized protein LAESUDRAFT_720993 [Laetiporus sulphureus 93-53]KZT10639.1 hypothetical protein LAESUDRAFT_720993 [Laetiporus sulphureus 93-53]